MYLWFIIIAKCYYTIWFLLFGLVGLLYVIQMYKNKKDSLEKDQEEENKNVKTLNTLEKILAVLTFILILFGFIAYMGVKKMEYGKKFNYLTFIFGMPECRGQSHKFPGYLTLLAHAFNLK